MIDEGYIKYRCDWIKEEAIAQPLLQKIAPQTIADLTAYRNALHRLNFINEYPDGIGFGNISHRLLPSQLSTFDSQSPDYFDDSLMVGGARPTGSLPLFVITGTQTGNLPTLTAADYALVTAFNPEQNTLTCKLSVTHKSLKALLYKDFSNCLPNQPSGKDFSDSCKYDDSQNVDIARLAGYDGRQRLKALLYKGYTDFCLMDSTCKGLRQASSESLTHGVIYASQLGINAIIHVHSPQLWKLLLHQVPTTRADVPYGTPEMAAETQRLFQESPLLQQKIFVMAGHEDGIVTFGENLQTAYRVLINWSLMTGFMTQTDSEFALQLPYQPA